MRVCVCVYLCVCLCVCVCGVVAFGMCVFCFFFVCMKYVRIFKLWKQNLHLTTRFVVAINFSLRWWCFAWLNLNRRSCSVFLCILCSFCTLFHMLCWWLRWRCRWFRWCHWCHWCHCFSAILVASLAISFRQQLVQPRVSSTRCDGKMKTKKKRSRKQKRGERKKKGKERRRNRK